MKLSSWLIGPMAMADETEIPSIFGNIKKISQKPQDRNNRTRNGGGVFDEVSCKARQIWQTENPEKGILGSCPKGSEVGLDPVGIISQDVFGIFFDKWAAANDELNFAYGYSGGLLPSEGGCLCMTGCEDVRRNSEVDIGDGDDMCCEDWAEVASVHCPQEDSEGSGTSQDDVNPCPTTECWTYDANTNTCSITNHQTCASLSCGATGFDLTFESALFNLDDNQETTFAGGLSPTWDGSKWALNAPLGENGMTYIIDAEKNVITFSLPVAMIGNEMNTRSDTIQDNLILLGSQSVVTTPFGAAVVFGCEYDLTIDVTSQDFTVSGASVVDTLSGMGSLADGFSMVLNNGEPANFLLGQDLAVEISWSVTALSTVTFHIDECNVSHGTTNVAIVKQGCYSETLDVTLNANRQGLSYQVFKGFGETEEAQKIKCSVHICEGEQCQHSGQCPATGDDTYYGYKV